MTAAIESKVMRVLLVEDNDPLRDTVTALLKEEGYDVETAENGELGLYKATNWDFDIIVLDVMMPVMDGWEMLKRLRVHKDTPVIMLTARNAVSDKVEGLNLGADDYMNKPFDIAELVARIRSIARRTTVDTERVIEHGRMKLDKAARSVSVGNKVIETTAKEYALIEMFASRPGEVVSREYIYLNFFDDEDETTSNVLDVYIYKLRKKLGKDAIKTKRGYGYVFNAEAL